MQSFDTAIEGVRLLRPRRYPDARGWFQESWNARSYAEAGLPTSFLQDNLALNHEVATLRGLHFQRPPAAQGKLVWVLAGAVLDVVVDIRVGSPTYGRHVAVELDAAEGCQLWVPEGFAHGYCTVQPHTLFMYKVTRYYDPASEAGIDPYDPALAIAWPFDRARAILNEKDRRLPRLAELQSPFSYGGLA